ncbi:IS110 family transposase [Acuticoccus sp.]|uniref:IS110 family transposase n=1 Tax=Acuticoccus sp. TaxID=1904378 RepID=UPI003B5253F4
MKLYAGLDISQVETSVCVVDHDGRSVHETRVATDPAAIVAILKPYHTDVERIGIEACSLSEWLFQEMSEAGWPVVCLEVRRLKATLAGTLNKTDRNDARGIAQVVRIGWFRAVHVKSRRSQELRFLLSARKSTLNRVQNAENELRGLMKTFGLRIGPTTRCSFAARVRELVADQVMLCAIAEPLLNVRDALLEAYRTLHRMVLRIVREDETCRRFKTVPGVGPIAALSFKTAIDAPARFSRSRTVGAYLGMTPRRYQSGEIDRSGRISRIGDPAVRAVLFEAASALLTRVTRWSALKAWGTRLAGRAGLKTAKVAVARKIAVILHRMWLDGTEFRWSATA